MVIRDHGMVELGVRFSSGPPLDFARGLRPIFECRVSRELSRGRKHFMAFDRRQAESNLREILDRIRQIDFSIDKDILQYRQQDTLVDEEDERRTMLDIREYLLRAYRRMDDVLTILDKYK